ncbi:DUF2125 domain-containing protein [Roseovarius salinarum]|uniref:DUF2125 domain-containing protein n=1 Tax=Roseovarius salinarum TaxID=1981892 RepID=UPI000C34FA09|nr:DUF2125 domain-containing protein [Roseovarius salinarum]
MKAWNSLRCGVTGALVLAAPAAWADVTPEQVWANWRAYLEGFGYEVSAEERMAGDTLTVSDLRMTFDIPEEDGTLEMSMGDLMLEQKGDGTVAVSIPPKMPVTLDFVEPDGEAGTVVLDATSKGFSMTVSGNPGAMTYNYSAAAMGLALADIDAPDVPEDFGTASMSIANMTGTTEMQAGDPAVSSQTLNTGAVTYDLDLKDPESGDRMVMQGGFGALSVKGDGTLPKDVDTSNLARMIDAGFAISFRYAYEAGHSKFNFKDGEDVVQGETSSDEGALTVDMSADGISYGGSAQNYAMNAAVPDLPFPIELGMEEMSFDMAMPVKKSEELQDFGFALTLAGFEMSEMIWGMFDPAGQLPHEPATVAIDVDGKARLTADIVDPEQMAEIEDSGTPPGELDSLNINAIEVDAVGARLTGEGAFTFDNSDLESFDGMPAPKGEANLKLVGGNGLLDKLTEMGLLPEEQANGARMMMGLFAVPGEGEDTLTSKIEVTEEGQVLANGQRLK